VLGGLKFLKITDCGWSNGDSVWVTLRRHGAWISRVRARVRVRVRELRVRCLDKSS